jgi:cytochrome c553
VAQGNTPKVDSSAKLIGFVAAILLLAPIFYLVNAMVNVVDRTSFEPTIVDHPATPAAPAAATASGSAPAASPAPAPAAEKTASAGGDASAGKAKFASCAACHGMDGKGNGGAFPDLTKLSAADADTILTAFKKGDMDTLKKHNLGGARYGTMAPQVANLSETDIANLAAYIAELGGHTAAAAPAATAATPAPATAAAPAAASAAAPAPAKTAVIISSETVARGHAYFSSCAICHGAEGEGGHLLNAPKLAGLPANSVVSLLELYRKGQQMGPNSYAMIPQAKYLTDDEIHDLAAFISTIGKKKMHGTETE